MAIESTTPGNVGRMEGADGSQGLSAQSQGQSYEQITEFLKSQPDEAPEGEEPETPSAPEAPEHPAEEPAVPATPAPAEDSAFFRLTEEQIVQLPKEAQDHLRRVQKDMQAAYTKKTQALAEERKRLESAQPRPPEAPAPPVQPPPAPAQAQVPPEYVEMRRKTLPPEMAWLAESLALGDFQRDQAILSKHVAPVQQAIQAQAQARVEADYKAAQDELAGKYPEWDAHQDEMVEVVRFLQGRDLRHPKYGNKLELLYRLVQGDTLEAKTAQTVLERTAQAAKAKSVTPSAAGRATTPNTTQRVREAKNDTEAWRMITAEP